MTQLRSRKRGESSSVVWSKLTVAMNLSQFGTEKDVPPPSERLSSSLPSFLSQARRNGDQ